MALKRVSQLPAFNGVPATGVAATATLDIPIGPRYSEIIVKGSDTANANLATMVLDCRVKVNGRTQRQFTIGQGDYINSLQSSASYYTSGTTRGIVTPGESFGSLFKNASNVTRFPIFFSEPGRVPGVEAALAWPTGNLSSFQLELDVASTASTKTIQAYAAVDNAIVTTGGLQKAAPMGKIIKWVRTSMDVNGTTKNWQNFWKRDVLVGVHFFDTALTNVQLLADSYEWRNVSQDDNLYHLSQHGMVGTASNFNLVMDYDDIVSGGGLRLDGIQDLRLNITLSDGTARNIPVILELYGDPD